MTDEHDTFDAGYHGLPPMKKIRGISFSELAIELQQHAPGTAAYLVVQREMRLKERVIGDRPPFLLKALRVIGDRPPFLLKALKTNVVRSLLFPITGVLRRGVFGAVRHSMSTSISPTSARSF